MVRPGLELILAVFALFRIGAVPVVIDPGMGLKSFLNCVRRTQPEALVGITPAHIISKFFRKTFQSLQSSVVINSKWLASVQNTSAHDVDTVKQCSTDELAAILFTSGSTGMPKGVCYTHGMFDGQVRALREAFSIQPGEIDYPFLPIFALFNPALGACTVVPDVNPSKPASLDAAKTIAVMEQYHVTTSFGSPVIWKKIADYCEAEGGMTYPHMKRILMAGAAVPPELLRRSAKIFPNALIETPYGATEVLPVSSISATEILEETASLAESGHGLCVGKQFPGVQIKILPPTNRNLDPEDLEKECTPGKRGEIVVTGPTVTKEYHALTEETRKAKITTANGTVWHRMGDIGTLDVQGRLWFCGRKAERVCLPNGKIFDTECTELFLNRHPLVWRSALLEYNDAGEVKIAFAAELHPGEFPTSRAKRTLLESELLNFVKKESGEQDIAFVRILKKFPVDVRHNAKIHRLTIARRLRGKS